MTRTGRSLAALLSAAVIGGLLASGVVMAADHRTESSDLRCLAGAVGPHRVTRARLTGGFAYALCDTAVPNDSLVMGLVPDCATSAVAAVPAVGQAGGDDADAWWVACERRAPASRGRFVGDVWGNFDEAIVG